ncbi:MAG TPA: AraC family transcriptional regulator [Flavitalea sp.]|nr:AraC family transcriptional regulator [Flavitalea sp.]HTF28682.1 AraC family transcriptional regulator [Flavitalea sp.]
MKHCILKSAIPDSKMFLVKELHESHFDPTFHLHPEHQLFLVLKGEGMRFVGDIIKPFKEGDMVFTGPNVPHVWRNDNAYFKKANHLNVAGIVIYFRDNFLGETLQNKEELENIHHLLRKSVRGLEITGETNRVISKMMIELTALKGVDSLIQVLKILDVIARSSECHFITHNHYVTSHTEAETNRMNKVYEHVLKNFQQKILLKEVADISNMTLTSFSRYFKSRVNKSFSDFLREIRIDYACKLLNEEKLSIEQVAYECGFHTISNFNKQFKQVTGKQPRAYRNEYLKVKIEAYGDF